MLTLNNYESLILLSGHHRPDTTEKANIVSVDYVAVKCSKSGSKHSYCSFTWNDSKIRYVTGTPIYYHKSEEIMDIYWSEDLADVLNHAINYEGANLATFLSFECETNKRYLDSNSLIGVSA